ncbi:SET and MYND domain-containing protein 4 [Escovopsis weberi]|uniref:SET and MYND domain-containing protein 4 n=1 Tax=Escovopsis weberi TaxID=150374 RepID=A0A0M8N505_ESCWE|nr:SET and MYND domain-containing protein 4 [Escovopsis weberi]
MPLFVADLSTLLGEFNKLEARAKDVALSLHASGGKLESPPIRKIWDTNCFTLRDGDLAGLFPIAARFNHACSPANNIDFRFDRDRGHLTLTVGADRIAAGEEMTISYGSGRSPLELYVWYGFRCRCGACGGLSDAELERFREAQW